MGLKAGNVCDLLEKSPDVRFDHKILELLLRHMLEALDYLAFRRWCHRDVKPEDILFTWSGNNGYMFQLPKMDGWSLFVVIGIVTQAGGLHGPKVARYEEILDRFRAQRKCFDGQGLSTPRNRIGPMPDPVMCRSNRRSQNNAKPVPTLKAPRPKAPKPVASDLNEPRMHRPNSWPTAIPLDETSVRRARVEIERRRREYLGLRFT